MDENQQKDQLQGQNLKTIRTYTSDMADAVRENEATVIKIALAEKAKREQEAMYRQAEGTPFKKLLFAFGGIILVVAAGVGIYFLVKKNVSDNAVEPAPQAIAAIVSYDDQAFVDLTNAKTSIDIHTALVPALTKEQKSGNIGSIFLTKTADTGNVLLPLSDLVSTMKLSAPDALIRTLNGYMVGSYTDKDLKSHLFLAFTVKDFNQAYASMLGWEPTMLKDLFILFGTDVSGDRSTLLDKEWKDVIIDNRDARILYDQEGNDVLYYLFPDKSDLIITDSKDALKEISVRLRAAAAKPL